MLGLLEKNNKNLIEEEEERQIAIFYFARRARKLRYYGDVVYSFYRKSAVEPDGRV